MADQSALLGLCVALGIGLLVGAERERRKDTSRTRNAAGIRTFSVSSLLGAVSVLLGDGLVFAVAALVVGAGALVAYQRTHDQDPGMTTEFALLLTCLLGGFAIHNPVLAAAVGVVLALLLAGRYRIHHFVRNVQRSSRCCRPLLPSPRRGHAGHFVGSIGLAHMWRIRRSALPAMGTSWSARFDVRHIFLFPRDL